MKFGLIGHPITHSLSPALFKAGYDGIYPYELIETDDFETAYGTFLKGFDGINVTAPFKELAYAKADIHSEECRMTGATNILIKTPEGIKAHNSDYLGVRLWLQQTIHDLAASGLRKSKRTPPTSWAPPPCGQGATRFSPSLRSEADEIGICQTVLIVGTGGAGKAAAAAAASLGLHCILMNRDMSKATRLGEDLNAKGCSTEVRPLCEFQGCFRKADIIIYNIPTAIPELNQLTDTDFSESAPKFILEANYRNPSFSEEFIGKMSVSGAGVRYTGGKVWLLYQAMTGYEIFTGEKPDLIKMSAVL
ncbi:MAG: hypothetical protein IJ005_02590 [Bacteroidales bacterium]|nr:hypothetical protein [Bacteroidales bacterium]